MPQAGREQDHGDDAPIDPMIDVVGYLRAELDTIRQREQRRDVSNPVEVSALDEPAEPPPPHHDRPQTTEITHLTEQIDGLRVAMADRFDAVQSPDLQPILDGLDQLHQEVSDLPVVDLHPVRQHLDTLLQHVRAIPAPDLEPVRSSIERLNQQVETLPRTAEMVAAIETAARSLRTQIHGIADVAPQVRQALDPLGAGIDRLLESDNAVRDGLVLTTEVLVGLTQLSETGALQLSELLSGQKVTTTEQRSLVARMAAFETNMEERLLAAVAGVEERLDARLHAQLDDLGLSRLQASVEDLAHQAAAPNQGDEPTAVTPAIQQAVAEMTAELEAVRTAMDTRQGSRWRRRGEPEAEPASEAALPDPTELERRLDQALTSMDQRLARLTRRVERAAVSAIEAVNAATAAAGLGGDDATARRERRLEPWVERGGTATAPEPALPAKKAPAKKAPAKKAPAKKKPEAKKKAPAKKPAAKKTSTRKTAAKKTAAKKAPTPRRRPAARDATPTTPEPSTPTPSPPLTTTTPPPPPPPPLTLPPPPPPPPPAAPAPAPAPAVVNALVPPPAS